MSRRDEELSEELEGHLRMAAAERMASGQSRSSAEYAARREFGNVTHVKEVTREVRGGVWFERLRQDLRYGWRGLRRTPAFTVVAVLTLALGIGANSAVFTVVNGVLLKPLPFPEPNRLFLASYIPTNLPFEVPPGLADGDYLAFRERTKAFKPVAAYQRSQMTLTGAGDADRLTTARVAAEFFAVLGVQPAAGRPFRLDEEKPGQEHVAILSDWLWRERYHADARIIGKYVGLDGIPYTVVGIMPPSFDFPARTALWTPLAVRIDSHNSFIFPVVGRLTDSATPVQAREELEAAVRRPGSDSTKRQMEARIIPLKQLMTARIENQLLLFLGAVTFVLLIACANVANLLLMRAATRRQEVAVRIALGASRTRIVRQLLTESTIVALLGGALGVAIASVGVRALLLMAPPGRIPRIAEVHLDGWVLTFTLGVAMVTGLAFGLAPALRSSQREPREALGHGTRTVTGSHARLRGAFVVAQIALALILLAGAGLMVRSFINMRAVETGFDPGNVVTMAVDLPHASYPDAARMNAFHDALVRELSRVPGVSAVGAVSWRPMGAMGIMGDFRVDGPTPVPNGYNVDKPTVGAGYFRAMGIRLLSGRDFTERDDSGSAGVAIVSASVAKRVWPSGDAVGRRITMADRPKPEDWLTVVGVVDDVVQDGELRKHSTIYLPYRQVKSLFFIDHMTYVVRMGTSGPNAERGLRAALRAVDPTVPAQNVNTMARSMLENVAEPLFQTRLLAAFSFIALLLAAIGTYGVLAYDVAERRHEIGLRVALGATPSEVVGVVMRRTIWLATPGLLLGVIGALAITRVLTKSLYQVKPNDPGTLAIVVAVIALLALVAGYIPARKATHVDPLEALAAD